MVEDTQEEALVGAPAIEMVRKSKPASQFRLVDVIDDLVAGREVLFRYVQSVGDLMTSPVHKLTLDDNVQAALALMEEKQVRHLPLVEVDEETNQESFIGIVSDRDVARQISIGAGTAGEAETDAATLKGSLSNCVTRNPQTASPADDLFEAIEKMITLKISCLPVMSGPNSMAGILTSTDILGIFLKLGVLQKLSGESCRKKARLIDLRGGSAPLDSRQIIQTHFQTLGDIMTTELKTIGPEATLQEAMKLMADARVRHLPVVDGPKGLVGLLTDRDILHALPPMAQGAPSLPSGQAEFRDKLFAVEEGAAARKLEVRGIMKGIGKCPTEVPGARSMDAVHTMVRNKVDAIVVVDEDDMGKLRGMVTATDFMRCICVLGQMLSMLRA